MAMATASLVVTRSRTVVPFQVAAAATGNAARFPELAALNPQIARGGTWGGLIVGAKLELPVGWDANKLRAAGYEIVQNVAPAPSQLTVTPPGAIVGPVAPDAPSPVEKVATDAVEAVKRNPVPFVIGGVVLLAGVLYLAGVFGGGSERR